MKKNILILSFSLLALCSCSSDSNSNENNSLLFKRWYYVSHTQNGTTFYPLTCTNGQRDYIDIISPNIANFYYINGSNGSNCSGNYAMEPYTFTQNGSVLNMTYSNGNDPSVITISELTATSLKFVQTWNTGSAYRVYSSY